MLRHIEDAARSAVVVLERHALLNGAIAFDVNDIAALVHMHVRRQRLVAMSAELLREHVPRAAADALRIRHCDVRLSEARMLQRRLAAIHKANPAKRKKAEKKCSDDLENAPKFPPPTFARRTLRK